MSAPASTATHSGAPLGAVAIILARAGSKGVPGKNVAMISGKPCIAWTIAHARAASTVLRVVVSSDDARALAIAREHSCEVVERPPALASDAARIDDAARHALLALESRDNGAAPAPSPMPPLAPIVILYANVPVRPDGLIDRAVHLLHASACDSVQSYQPVGKFHPWWTARVNERGVVAPWEGDVLNHGVFRRQDLPPAFIPDGAVIALTRRALMLEVEGASPGPHQFFGTNRRGVINPEGSVVDIDAPLDLVVAEAMLNGRRSGASD